MGSSWWSILKSMRNLSSEFVDRESKTTLDADEKQFKLRTTHFTDDKSYFAILKMESLTAVASMMEMVSWLYKIKESHGVGRVARDRIG